MKEIQGMQRLTEIEKTIGKIVLEAVKIREASYDLTSQEKAEEKKRHEVEQWKIDHPDEIYFSGLDYSQFYTKSFEQCCEEAAANHGMIALGRLVYLALDSWFNDTCIWAGLMMDPNAVYAPCLSHCTHGVAFPVSEKLEGEDMESVDGLEEKDDLGVEDNICPLCEEWANLQPE